MRIDDETHRLEAIEKAVVRLREEARGGLVVVEGGRDRQALEELGVPGHHFAVNRGVALEVLMDQIVHVVHAERLRKVVLLTDWDRTGGRLFARLRDGLRARVGLETEVRRLLATLCHVRTFEEVPAELASLRHRLGHPGRPA
jgi:5S rRNA maturation endonuclease (ribonuclease M5)